MNEFSSTSNSGILKNSYGLDDTDTMAMALKKRREKAFEKRGLNDQETEDPKDPEQE